MTKRTNPYSTPPNQALYSTVTIGLTTSPCVNEHDLVDVVEAAPKGRGTRASPGLMPGGMVRHVEDERSFGVVVSLAGDRCTVLWSALPRPRVPNVPINIQTQAINTPSRRLKVQWTVEESEDARAFFNKDLLRILGR